MLRTAILDDYQDVALQMADWSSLSDKVEVTVFRDHTADRNLLVERLKHFDAICLMRERTPIDYELLSRLPALKFICSTGRANASLDVEAAEARGIRVRMTGSRGNGAAELTWALILAAARNIPQEIASVREGGWQVGVGVDLEGSTLGVVGLGRIGSRVASVAHAFGMRVLAWSPNLTLERAQACGADLVEKETLFAQSDFVSLHMALGSTTKNLVGVRELGKMRCDSWLINTSRSQIVNEEALINALTHGQIAGAALDVFDEEPLPTTHSLRALNNVIATPHIGFVTRANYRAYFSEVVRHLSEWVNCASLPPSR